MILVPVFQRLSSARQATEGNVTLVLFPDEADALIAFLSPTE
jgi:hypothetical protein